MKCLESMEANYNNPFYLAQVPRENDDAKEWETRYGFHSPVKVSSRAHSKSQHLALMMADEATPPISFCKGLLLFPPRIASHHLLPFYLLRLLLHVTAIQKD
ncbi:hypothetical protein KQX54_011592 [Cotesia glomerata]|uniref:Uncharacterized protein n=1 Tax=Cotesia glomerata TaxID=32391 RepID=A0AAV7J601_COTGL|nr:hypothetical protein KQX54_011592 [Cotesia glomerata]